MIVDEKTKRTLIEGLVLGDSYNRGEIHRDVCESLNALFIRKNRDYGNSYAKQRIANPSSLLVRLFDKYSRLDSILNSGHIEVTDESVEDTLRDLANYCIMEIVERRIERVAENTIDAIISVEEQTQVQVD